VSEQSSVVVMFRALVMLVCLIAIPLAALFGSSLPMVVEAVRQGRCPTLAELRGTSVPRQSSLSDAPPFTPTPPGAQSLPGVPSLVGPQPPPGSPPLLGDHTPAANDSLRQPVSGAPPVPWSNQGAEAPAVLPARYDAPLDRVGRPASVLPGAEPNLIPVGPGGDNPALTRSDTGPLSRPGDLPAEAASQATANGSDSYTVIQDRLRQLGATYYLLESWGDPDRQYRFFCRMAIGGNAKSTRSFWSIDTDPFKAMRQVLQQVEAWRSGRQ